VSALERVFFPLPAFRRTPASILWWWESRRPLYNAIVGATGLGVLAYFALLSELSPRLGLHPPWQLVAAYALAANVCYSLGWMIETVLHVLWGERAPLLGPALFRQGLIFSIGLTLLPALPATLACAVDLAQRLVGWW